MRENIIYGCGVRKKEASNILVHIKTVTDNLHNFHNTLNYLA